MVHTLFVDALQRLCSVRAGALLALAIGVLSCSERAPLGASPIEATQSRVLQTTRRTTTRLVTVRTEKSTLVTTPDHPFAKVDSGWTPAADLAVGDRIHIRGSAAGAKVLELSLREVPPTAVYNLTVDRTHTYFVGSQDLLVHNVGCFGRSFFGRKRRFNDVGTKTGNCSACTLAVLGDYDRISDFLKANRERPNINDSLSGLSNSDFIALMRQMGLRSDRTPDEAAFPATEQRRADPGRSTDGPTVLFDATRVTRTRFEHWDAVENFMRGSTANTFAVTYQHVDELGLDNGHVLVGIRKEDGTIAFLDFSRRPPEIRDLRSVSISSVRVIPSDVDWRESSHVQNLLNPGTSTRTP
jgi:hypothetical protein